jgi:hypothetical protein
LFSKIKSYGVVFYKVFTIEPKTLFDRVFHIS